MFAYKKAFFVLALILVFSLMSTMSLAWGEEVEYTTYPADTEATEMLFFEISRPKINDSITSKYFFICGNIMYDHVTVETYIYSELDKCYVPFANIHGESKWDISEAGYFSEDIVLPNMGENKLLVVAYRTSEPDKKQFSILNVFIRKETILEKFLNGLDKALDYFSNLIGK